MAECVQMSSRQRIVSLEKRRSLLVERLLQTEEMIRGTFYETFRRCGKQNCWCVEDQGHPSCRVTWTESGKPKTKAVPPDDTPWTESMTKNYRAFRKARQKLRAEERQLSTLLNHLEEELDNKTRRKRDYFDR